MLKNKIKNISAIIFSLCITASHISATMLKRVTELNIPGQVISSCLSNDGLSCFSITKEDTHYFLSKYDINTGQRILSILIGGVDESLLIPVSFNPIPDTAIIQIGLTPEQVFRDMNKLTIDKFFEIKISKHDRYVVINKRNFISIFTSDLTPVLDDIAASPGSQIATFNIDDERGLMAFIELNGHGTVIKIPNAGEFSFEKHQFNIDVTRLGVPRSIYFIQDLKLLIGMLKHTVSIDASNNQILQVVHCPSPKQYSFWEIEYNSKPEVLIESSTNIQPFAYGPIIGSKFQFLIAAQTPYTNSKPFSQMFEEPYATINSVQTCADLVHFKIEGSVFIKGKQWQVIGIYDIKLSQTPIKFYFPPFLSLFKSLIVGNSLIIFIKNQFSHKHLILEIKLNFSENSCLIQRKNLPVSIKKISIFPQNSFIFQ